MRFTVRYIPLSKIQPDLSANVTKRILKLRNFMWDCMHLLAVRKNGKDGNFVILSGLDRYEYLRNHTNKKYAPCIIDESKVSHGLKSFLDRFTNDEHDRLRINPFKWGIPASWSIVSAFLKQEPRFAHLTQKQKVKVLLLGFRYKRTVVLSMRSMVDDK